MGNWNLHAIESVFAQAAIDPSMWDRAMEIVAAETGSFGSALFPIRGRTPRVPFTTSLGETFDKYLAEGWVHRDERYRTVPWIERRGVATDLDYIGEEGMRRNAYYQEFLAPFGLKWFAGVRVAADGELFSLSIQRSIGEGCFSRNEQRKLAALSPRLCTAAAVARAFGFARAEAALDAFAASGSAVTLLDRRGEVVRANAAAERLLDTDPRVVRRRIVSLDREATAALDRSLHELLWQRAPSALMPPVSLPRCDRRPVLAYPMRLEAVTAGVLAPCQAIVVLIDPERAHRPPETHLRALFRLTPAEARLALRLASGEALADAANELGIARETARVQLKAVFEKTAVHRQAELVALLARLCARPK